MVSDIRMLHHALPSSKRHVLGDARDVRRSSAGPEALHLIVAVSAVAFAASCATDLKQAAGTFADATISGVSAFRPISTAAYDVCLMRAESAFLKQRVSGERPWGSSPKRSEYFTEKSTGPVAGLAWNDYCDQIQKVDSGLVKIYAGLLAYASALKHLAGAADVSSDELKTMGVDAQKLASELMPANALAGTGAATMLTAYQTAAPSLASLATIVEGIIAEGEIQKSIVRTDVAIQVLLMQLVKYASAVQEEAFALENDTQVLLDWMDTKMETPSPLVAAEYSVYAQQSERTARNEIRLQDSYKAALKALSDAHGEMTRAAQRVAKPADVLVLVRARARTVESAAKDIDTIANAKWSTR